VEVYLSAASVSGIADDGAFENRQFKYSIKADRSTNVDVPPSASVGNTFLAIVIFLSRSSFIIFSFSLSAGLVTFLIHS
jgi:hypothetical protein